MATFDPLINEPQNASSKFVIGDIQNPDAYSLYKKALASFWVEDSIDFSNDEREFEKLRPDEQSFLLTILAFFAGSDGIVLENLAMRFYSEVKQPEPRLFYGLQMAIENIHSEVYSQAIKTLVRDREKRAEIFGSIDRSNAVQKKAEWAKTWIGSDRPFGERLVAFAAVEGIMFSSSFCAIFYFRKRGIPLRGLYTSNEYISRDEGLHTEFACLLHKQLHSSNQASPDTVLDIVLSAVEVEKVFVGEALANPILGMNAATMCEYVEFVADTLLGMLGCKKHFNRRNPMPFMESISTTNKSNFFEVRVADYSLADVKVPSAANGGEAPLDGDLFSKDCDF